MQRRWPGGVPGKVIQLVEHELQADSPSSSYEPYFLTVHDIVAFARSDRRSCARAVVRRRIRQSVFVWG